MTLNVLTELPSRNSRYCLMNYKTTYECFYYPLHFTLTCRASSWGSQIRYVFSLGLPLSIQCIPLSDTGSLVYVNVNYWIIKQEKSVMKQLIWWYRFKDPGERLPNNLVKYPSHENVVWSFCVNFDFGMCLSPVITIVVQRVRLTA